MAKHYKGVLIMGLATLAAFIIATAWSPYLAVAVLALAAGVWFVMTVSWFRPRGEPPEHHTRADRWLHDTEP